MKRLLLVLLALTLCIEVSAQASGDAETETPDYEPYAEDEFPGWAQVVRRAEVVLIGSFPITILFSSLLYEGGRAVIEGISGVPSTGTQAFGNEEYSTEESKWILISGALLSAFVAAADYLLGTIGTNEGE